MCNLKKLIKLILCINLDTTLYIIKRNFIILLYYFINQLSVHTLNLQTISLFGVRSN